MSEQEFKLGKSNFEQKKKNYFKLSKKQTELIVRVLPPMFSGVERGQYSKYYRVEFGYYNTKGRLVPFQDTRVVNRKTKMVEVESAAYLKRMQLKAVKENLIKNGGSEEDKAKITDLQQRYNMASSHNLNVITLNGEIGLLSLSSDAFDAIKKELKRLEAEGVDATAVETGRFFILSREGERLDTKYYAREYKQKKTVQVEGQSMVVEVPFNHVLDEATIKRLPREAFDLNTLHLKFTPEEADAVVTSSAEVSAKLLDSLYEKYRPNSFVKKEAAAAVAPEADEEPYYEDEAPVAQETPKAAVAAPVQVATPVAAVVKEIPKAAPAVVAQAVVGENLNEWLAKMGAVGNG